jgi:hypothetical protein
MMRAMLASCTERDLRISIEQGQRLNTSLNLSRRKFY